MLSLKFLSKYFILYICMYRNYIQFVCFVNKVGWWIHEYVHMYVYELEYKFPLYIFIYSICGSFCITQEIQTNNPHTL